MIGGLGKGNCEDSSGPTGSGGAGTFGGAATPATPHVRALYVHIPFCLAKCRYCDFYSRTMDPGSAGEYPTAAIKELFLRGACLDRPVASAFVGGGTPTVLGADLLDRLLAAIVPLAGEDTEFSVEANPGTLDGLVVEVLAARGVNRVNLGVQSFDDSELRMLGRIHDAAVARAAVAMLRQAGLANVGIDLIYGIPGQTMASWRRSISEAVGLGIEHLSCYALSFEEHTPLWEDLRSGRVAQMDETLQRDCYYAAIEAAAAAGLRHYEISNFARPGRECRHNVSYWRNEPYLGIGPGAASYVAGERRTNSPDLRAYADSLAAGKPPPATSERLIGRALMAETLMLGLRMIDGVSRAEFAQRFGPDPVDAFPRAFDRYARHGAVVITPDAVHIAREALFVADTILADILAEA
ncbi:MAG: radical SAM family heme chaperone HemW [Phycisphaerae bacterium]